MPQKLGVCTPEDTQGGAPLRPIISSINAVTYNISKHLVSILVPLVSNTQHHVKNSLTNKVSVILLDPDIQWFLMMLLGLALHEAQLSSVYATLKREI